MKQGRNDHSGGGSPAPHLTVENLCHLAILGPAFLNDESKVLLLGSFLVGDRNPEIVDVVLVVQKLRENFQGSLNVLIRYRFEDVMDLEIIPFVGYQNLIIV